MDAYVQLTGNVGGAVEFHNQTVPIASFRLAHTPRVRKAGEWVDAPTTWITVTCFRALAENVMASVSKGQPVLVSGRLRTNVWTRDGQTYERLILEATTIGHDLTRGTATFRRAKADGAVEDRDAGVGALLDRVESQDAGDQALDEPEAGVDAVRDPGDQMGEQVDEDGVVTPIPGWDPTRSLVGCGPGGS